MVFSIFDRPMNERVRSVLPSLDEYALEIGPSFEIRVKQEATDSSYSLLILRGG